MSAGARAAKRTSLAAWQPGSVGRVAKLELICGELSKETWCSELFCSTCRLPERAQLTARRLALARRRSRRGSHHLARLTMQPSDDKVAISPPPLPPPPPQAAAAAAAARWLPLSASTRAAGQPRPGQLLTGTAVASTAMKRRAREKASSTCGRCSSGRRLWPDPARRRDGSPAVGRAQHGTA